MATKRQGWGGRCALPILFAVAAYAENVQYSFEYYGQEHGLASSLVRSLVQDQTGFLWVATPIGLFRWDGFRFRQYTKDDGLPENVIRAVHVDRTGVLWVGTNGGLARLVGDRFQIQSERGLELSGKLGLASDTKGNVYAATKKGLYVLRKGWFERVGSGLDGFEVSGLWVDLDGSLWFGCNDAICRWDGTKLDTFSESEGVPRNSYSGFARDGVGNLLARGPTAVLISDRGTTNFRPELVLDGGGSTQLLCDYEGRLFAPSWDGLWIRGTGGKWRQVTEKNGLPTNRINAVWADAEGSLWLGFSDFGIARWRGQGDWEGWTRENGLQSNSVTAILHSQSGQVWVGTRNGLSSSQPDGGFQPFPALANVAIRSLSEPGDGWIWVTTQNEGLWHIHSVTKAAQHSPLPDAEILSTYVEPDGKSIWITSRSGVYRTAVKGFARPEKVLTDVLQKGEQIYAMRRDGEGRLWMAGTRGVLVQDNGVWLRFAEKDGLAGRIVVLLEKSVNGDLWIGYGRYQGVSRIHLHHGKLQITHFNKQTALASNDISFVSTDHRGWIWVGTDNGIDIFNGETWRHIGTRDGLIWHDTVLNAFTVDRNGSVWIGTNRGLSHFLPRAQLFSRPPPGIAITGASFSGRKFDDPLAVPYKGRSPRITYSTMSFSQSSDVRFRYRLIGLDRHWMQTTEREAAFPNLTPGHYEFEVQAGSRYEWNKQSAVLRFRILTPWWRSYWFVSSFFVLLMGLAYAFHQHRMRRVHLQRELLEVAVNERTAELGRAKTHAEQETRKVEEQKRAIEQLLEQAQDASRLKGEFLANVSHEIRTPMNGILGMTSLALETNLQAEQRDLLECAKTSGEALLSLLNDILDFSKIEANRLELESVPYTPLALLEECIRTVRPSIGDKNIRLESSVAPDVPLQLLGDPTRLRQVILNLLSNAIKFTHEGFVSVRLNLEPTDSEAKCLTFRVIDTGEGIAEEKHTLIFEAFRQADGSTTRRFGGTGLGLAICSRLVKLMGGEIQVESQLGKGSEFLFRLPVQKCQMSISGAKTKPSSGELGKLALALSGMETRRSVRVLVVEDNPINQKLVVRMLERQGHEVEVAADGKQAIQLSGHKKFDLILMDVQMPELDGLMATRLIRERESKSGGRVPILMLTANVMPGDREKCLEAGADDYLSKPVSYDRLTAAVVNLISS